MAFFCYTMYPNQSGSGWQALLRSPAAHTLALWAIAIGTIHAITTLLFNVLGLAPSSDNWFAVPLLASFLACGSTAVALQSWVWQQPLHGLLGTASGAAAGAVVGFFLAAELIEQNWTVAGLGLCAGAVFVGFIAQVVYRAQPRYSLWAQAIALVSGLCGYGLAFGLAAWALAAFDTGRLGLAVILGGLSVLYLFSVRRSLVVVGRYRARS